MTVPEACALTRALKQVFDIVRLVDVERNIQYRADEDRLVAEKSMCYAVWNKHSRCENCVSARARAQKARVAKYEFIGSEVYHVVAQSVEVDGKAYVLEVVSNVTDQALFGAVGKPELIEMINQYNHHLYTDSLTGCFNREYYSEQLRALSQDCALAMVDLDNFRDINGGLGREAGNHALRLVSNALTTNIHAHDTVIRYGGDEFLIVFRDMLRAELRKKLETLRSLVERARSEALPDLRVTVSIGACAADETAKDRIHLINVRLLKAKATKNAVCCE